MWGKFIMSKKYQTLSEFMRSPFHRTDSMEKDMKYEAKYNEFIRENKIYVAGYMNIEDSYYIHIKVPSESQKAGKYEYDVVIRFFTDDPSVLKSLSLRAYYIQFFSNSPSFIYKYAALYKKEGYLIDLLYNKLDPDYVNVMPEKTNSDMELSYDKSIYFACKFLSAAKFRVLNKGGILLQKKKTPVAFLAGISDFRSVKFDQELLATEKKMQKTLGISEKKAKDKAKSKIPDIHRKMAQQSTSQSQKSITRKVATKSTNSVKLVMKKRAGKSTTKR